MISFQTGSMLNLLATLFIIPAHAATYQLAPNDQGKYGLSFKLGYTLGTHEGQAKALKSHITINPTHLDQTRGWVEIPVQQIRTGKSELDCHMWESLGLDYGKSDFPDNHVCENDQLPRQGKNALVHKSVRLEIRSLKPAANSMYDVQGHWLIHGVKKKIPSGHFKIRIQKQESGYRVQGKTTLTLKDFGIVVKSFLFITVKDQALLDIDARVVPRK